jgi:hypothetical protein
MIAFDPGVSPTIDEHLVKPGGSFAADPDTNSMAVPCKRIQKVTLLQMDFVPVPDICQRPTQQRLGAEGLLEAGCHLPCLGS